MNHNHLLTCSRDRRARLYNLESPHELSSTFYVKDFVPQKAWFDDDAVYILGNETYMFYYKGEHLLRSPGVIGHKKAEVTGSALGTSLALLTQDGYILNLSRSSH